MIKSYMNWSGGKDSALTLYKILNSAKYEPLRLLTIVDSQTGGVCHHNIPPELLKSQADSIGITVDVVPVGQNPSNVQYEQSLTSVLNRYKDMGLAASIFGDIFLEDLRQYRQDKCAQAGFEAVFPLWQQDTTQLAREFINLGFKAVIISVDTEKLPASFAGRLYDEHFLHDLPANVDPCGENGEFHSFTYAGPIFKQPLNFTIQTPDTDGSRFAACRLGPRTVNW
ncbi:MAG: hypothetical protein A2Y07_10750 [Planctomycetes bacterium GWF2_50_10]|nr:MAG: hypothetical protein A2Y07_10750 [Planctomycetes bacterium GWF2_50_10]